MFSHSQYFSTPKNTKQLCECFLMLPNTKKENNNFQVNLEALQELDSLEVRDRRGPSKLPEEGRGSWGDIASQRRAPGTHVRKSDEDCHSRERPKLYCPFNLLQNYYNYTKNWLNILLILSYVCQYVPVYILNMVLAYILFICCSIPSYMQLLASLCHMTTRSLQLYMQMV